MKDIVLVDAQSAATFANSAPWALGDIKDYNIQVEITGSNVVGTLKLQARNRDDASWIDVTDSSQAITSSGEHMWNVSRASYKFVRVSWAYTSGTGNISAYLHYKEVRERGP